MKGSTKNRKGLLGGVYIMDHITPEYLLELEILLDRLESRLDELESDLDDVDDEIDAYMGSYE